MSNYNLSAGWGSIEAQVAAATKNTTGKVFLVAASTVPGYDKLQQLFGFRADPEGTLRFFNTIDAAINATTADRGDVILVAPGHTETLTAAGAIAQDVANVSIIGLGDGDNVPSITFAGAATTTSWTVSADDCVIKNIRGVAGLDGLLNPFNVTGGNPTLDIRWDDASATVEAARAILLTDLNGARIKLDYRGFIAGNAVVNAIRLNNVGNTRIEIDAYGVCTTAWVEFVTALCDNVVVVTPPGGQLYTSGITDGTRNVVDTITGSLWSADIWDGSAGARQRGGSAEALAFDDVGDIASAIALATADAVTNADIGDQVGNKTDTAFADTIEGSVATTQSLNRLAKSILQRIGADSANNTAATTLVAANDDGSVLERLEGILQRVSGVDGATNVLGADDADNLFASTNVGANRDGSILERLEDLRQNESATGGLVYQGSTDAGMGASTVTVVSADLAGQTDDFFNNKYYMMVVKNTSTPGGAPENEVRLITDYVSATGTFTVTAFSVNVEASDEILVMHESLVLLGRDDGNNTFASTNVVANADGSVLERLETIQAAAIVIDEFHDVPAADNVLNAQINEVIGNKADAAAAGAVTATDTLVAYTKQLVTELQVVDEFHDVPAADNVLNAQINEVIGNKADAAAAGAVTATDTLVGYTKQLVTELQVVDGFHDVPGADVATNAQVRDVVGNKTDAAAAGDVSAVESLMAYAKQAITELSGTAGITTFPAAAAPNNGVAIADVLRDIWDVVRNGTGGAEPATNRSVMDYLGVTPAFFVPGLGFRVTKVGAMTATDDNLFDVTGKVAITLLEGEVTSALDANVTTMLLRIETDNVNLCAATTVTSDVDGTQYLLTGDFGDTLNGGVAPVVRAADKNSLGSSYFVVGNAGAASVIEHLLGAADLGTGAVTWTLFYLPLEAGATVAASA